jgi:replicative DNA helicase
MTPARVTERLLALEGRVRVDDLRHGALDEQTRAAVGAAAVRVRDAALVVETLPTSVDALADTLRRTLDLRLAVVDSLEHLVAGNGAREEELAGAMRRLKVLALELGVPILVTAQLTRLDRSRQNLRPRLEDFAALGAVREFADVVLGIYREEMYASANGVEGATELLALKNRNGPTGYVDLYFYARWIRFEDMLDPDR